MPIIDITVPISADIPVFPGDPGVEVRQWAAINKGDPANVSLLHFGAHTATHVDAPSHFIDGADRVGAMSLDILIGPVFVIEIANDVTAISSADLPIKELTGAERVIFKTRNSTFWPDPAQGFRTDFTYIDESAARALVEIGIKLVGFDYLSVENFHSTDYGTHQILLSNNVIIIEGLDLRAVNDGTYELICLPLKIESGTGDGAPARVVLRTIEHSESQKR